MSETAEEIEALKQELAGLRDTVTSQARIIGQLKTAKTEDTTRMKELLEARNRSVRWESIAIERGHLFEVTLKSINVIREELAALEKRLLAELRNKR